MKSKLNRWLLGASLVLAAALALQVTLHRPSVEPQSYSDNRTAFGPEWQWIPDANAQTTGASMTGTGGWGRVIPVWNTLADTLIVSGTLVMWDTTSTIKRLGVRPYDGTLSNRKRVAGWAFGPIPAANNGNGRGSIIIEGYVPDMKISIGNATAGQVYRVGTLHGAVKDGSDSVSMAVAYCLGATTGRTGSTTAPSTARYTIKAWAYPNPNRIAGSL